VEQKLDIVPNEPRSGGLEVSPGREPRGEWEIELSRVAAGQL